MRVSNNCSMFPNRIFEVFGASCQSALFCSHKIPTNINPTVHFDTLIRKRQEYLYCKSLPKTMCQIEGSGRHLRNAHPSDIPYPCSDKVQNFPPNRTSVHLHSC